MQEFKQRQKIKKRIYSKFTIAVLVLILLALLHGTWGMFQKMRMSAKKLEVAQMNASELAERQDAIGGQIGHLRTDSGLEEEVRTKYNLAREGEHVIVLVDPNEAQAATAVEAMDPGFWAKITAWFR